MYPHLHRAEELSYLEAWLNQAFSEKAVQIQNPLHWKQKLFPVPPYEEIGPLMSRSLQEDIVLRTLKRSPM